MRNPSQLTEEMKNPQNNSGTQLIKEFDYNVPVGKVWQALTDEDKMRKWYFPQIREFEPVAGFEWGWDNLPGNNLKYLLERE